MHIATKIKVNVTPEQEHVLWQLSNNCRLLYNFALAERKRNYQDNLQKEKTERTFIGYVEQANQLPDIKKKYPRYKSVYSKVLQTTLKTLDNDYRSFFALRKNGYEDVNPPGFKSRRNFCTMTYNQSGFKIYGNKIKFSQYYDKSVPLEFELPLGLAFVNVKQGIIFYDDVKNNFYIAIIHEIQPEHEYSDNEFYQAFDLGITKHVAVNSCGKFIEFYNERPDRYWKKPIADIQSRRDHCKKFSRKWFRLNHVKRRCEKKRSNQMKDFQHKLSTKIVNNTKANTIVVGDLNVKQMAQSKTANRGINASTQNTGYLSRFIGFLTYKATLVGKTVIKIDERYTSKMCCCCGELHNMPLSNRVMRCDCGNVIDRDCNSAVNIMVRFLSQNAKWIGYQQFVDNLRKTGVYLNGTLHSQEAPRESGV
jgi:putative transposase